MQYEVEMKFPVVELDDLMSNTIALGVKLAEPVMQSDYYFAHPARDFRQTDEALRIRRVGDEAFITYKGPKIDQHTKTRQELELPLAPQPNAHEQFSQLEALGFRAIGEVHKSRRYGTLTWDGREVELVLDRVQDLGTFVELETKADSADLDQARNCILSLATHLGLKNQERRGYLAMLKSS